MQRLMQLHSSGQLQVVIDSERFAGIQRVPDAVAHLQNGHSSGKVVVFMDPSAAKSHDSLEAPRALSRL
jgi:NADPH-dependent curcumin reductase CurA